MSECLSSLAPNDCSDPGGVATVFGRAVEQADDTVAPAQNVLAGDAQALGEFYRRPRAVHSTPAHETQIADIPVDAA